MTDSQIILLYHLRDEQAISESESKYGSYCLSIAMGILGSLPDAEECVSDTWLRAWNAIPPESPSSLKLFLARISRNLAFDRFRRITASRRGGGYVPAALSELEQCVGKGDTESYVSARELENSINTFLHSLPEKECSLFLRRYFYGESLECIAGRYGMKKANVSVILSRTRKKLKQFLIEEGYTI